MSEVNTPRPSPASGVRQRKLPRSSDTRACRRKRRISALPRRSFHQIVENLELDSRGKLNRARSSRVVGQTEVGVRCLARAPGEVTDEPVLLIHTVEALCEQIQRAPADAKLFSQSQVEILSVGLPE